MASSAARLITGAERRRIVQLTAYRSGAARPAGFDADSVVVYRGFVFSHFSSKRVSATVSCRTPETRQRVLVGQSPYCS
jgi:hypothetical protein